MTPDHHTADEIKVAALVYVTTSHRSTEAAIANRRDIIAAALDLGATWDDIGRAVGMSRQSAHKRFGHPLE